VLYFQTQVFAGSVLDLDWDSESKKIVASGEGTGIMVKAFLWDTGNSVGGICYWILHMYVHTYIYMDMYMYNICINTFIHTCIQNFFDVCMYIRIYTCINAYEFISKVCLFISGDIFLIHHTICEYFWDIDPYAHSLVLRLSCRKICLTLYINISISGKTVGHTKRILYIYIFKL
jgi:hypothetical protein